MAKAKFIVTCEFSSVHADGQAYKVDVEVMAESAASAEHILNINRVTWFGAKGNDNLLDWRAKPAT